jgi:integrase
MSIGVTSTGNHYVQYRIPGLKSPRKEYFGKGETGQDKAEVRKAEIKAGDVVTMESVAGRQVFMDELAQLYINYTKVTKGKKHWVKGLVGLVNNHYLPCLCHVPVNELTFSDVINVAVRFSEKSVCTQNRYMAYLHIMIRFGLSQGLIQKDPMQGWKKHRESNREVLLTMEDLQKIFAHSPPHLQWLLEVQWELGTRPGPSELLTIRWVDVDFRYDFIRVRGTKTKTSDRQIPISHEFKERLLVKRAEAESGYLIEYKGRPITGCRTAFKKACEAAKIDYPVRLYDIRHLFASTMLANGGDLKAVSKLLGHSTTIMTADVYYHELKGEKERALAVKPRLL